MARVLIVTGKLAEPIIRRVLVETKTEHEVDVLVIPVQVAAFLTVEYIARYLREHGVKDYDYMYHILTPGLTMELVKLSKKLPNIIRSYKCS
jgi:hypothetical protein